MCKEAADSWTLPTGAGIAAAHGCCSGPRHVPQPELAPRIVPPPLRPDSCAGSCSEEPAPEERADRSA